jgi:hypothetical protein
MYSSRAAITPACGGMYSPSPRLLARAQHCGQIFFSTHVISNDAPASMAFSSAPSASFRR